MLSGEIVEVTDEDELEWASKGMFVRHPATQAWPPSHKFSFFKLKKIENIFIVNFFGGATKHLDVDSYLSYQPKYGRGITEDNLTF